MGGIKGKTHYADLSLKSCSRLKRGPRQVRTFWWESFLSLRCSQQQWELNSINHTVVFTRKVCTTSLALTSLAPVSHPLRHPLVPARHPSGAKTCYTAMALREKWIDPNFTGSFPTLYCNPSLSTDIWRLNESLTEHLEWVFLVCTYFKLSRAPPVSVLAVEMGERATKVLLGFLSH